MIAHGCRHGLLHYLSWQTICMKAFNRLLLFVCILKLVLPFLIQHPFYELHRDEYLYLEEGLHPAWGYMEIPPLLSVFAMLAHALGDGFYAVKIWPALFGAATLFICGRLVWHLKGGMYALLLISIPIIFGGYLRMHLLFQPGFLEVFFWTLTGYSIIRFFQTNKYKYIYYFGIAAGLGMMSKYTTAFYLAALFAGILFTRKRILFINKHFWFSAFIGAIIFLPNLWWQYSHNFPVIAHMAELKETQLVHLSPAKFVIGQLFMHAHGLFVWLPGLYFLAFTKAGKPYRWLSFHYIIFIGLMAYFNAKDYYALGIYPLLFAFGAFHLEQFFLRKKVWVRYAFTSIMLLLALPLIPLSLPVAKPEKLAAYYRSTGIGESDFLQWEDQQKHPLPQDFADMTGWRDMAYMTANSYKKLPGSVRNNLLIYTRGYFSAGAINYYNRLLHLGLPVAHTDNASFLWWMPEKYNIKHLLLISHNAPDSSEQVFKQFKKVTILDSLNIPYFRETGMKVRLFENADPAVNKMIEAEIGAARQKFQRL